ncbi:MAG: metal-dependent hydrolase [archaeon]
MMLRTHLAITTLLILLFIPHVTFKVIFVIVALIATLIPDIDMTHSVMGKYNILRPIQWFVKHRGIFHSFTLALLFSLLFAFYLPILALPFFLGYSSHLIADSFTIDGIRPFWPLKDELKYKLRTGSRVESTIFYVLCGINIILFVRLFYIM